MIALDLIRLLQSTRQELFARYWKDGSAGKSMAVLPENQGFVLSIRMICTPIPGDLILLLSSGTQVITNIC